MSKLLFFELSVLIPLVFYLINSMSLEGPLNCISCTRFRYSFFWPWVNWDMFYGFDSVSIAQFLAMISSVSAKPSQNCVAYSLFSYFDCICCLSTTQFSLVKFSQIAVSCSKSWYWILQVVSLNFSFIVINFNESADMPCWDCFLYTNFGLYIQKTWLVPSHQNWR